MKLSSLRITLLCALCVLTACGSVFAPNTASKPEAANMTSKPKPVNNSAVASADADCNAQADSKLKLFDRPDTYPISAEERNNARAALFDECMKGHQTQVAGVYKSDTQGQLDTASLANLSPAAGGYPPNPPAGISASSYPGSTVVMVQGNTATQLANLSPSAGGNPGLAGSYPGATVVVVQAPTAAPATHVAPVMPQALARPIAVQAQKPVTVANTTSTATTTTPTSGVLQTPPSQPLYAAPPTYKSVPTSTVTAPDAATQQLERVLSQ